jgi:polyisoprenyl-teichoic acid--peptidoglycan teichoic acid transferase
MRYRRLRSSRSKPATWAGLLLGFLLALFVIVFLYVGLAFVAWGRVAVASVPDMPALPLPKLVRSAPPGETGGESQPVAPAEAAGPQVAKPEAPAAPPEKRITILIMGVDNRPDERVEATRTDTIIVLTVNPATGAAGMLSIPRDLLITVPALGKPAKINTVHVLGYLNNYPGGGPAMLKDTISNMIGYPIDYYVRVNFDGFRQIIDLIGGIDIDVPKDIDDPLYPDNNYGYEGFQIKAGHYHMDGALALKYARTRHADSDYGRASRQQQVIVAVKDKLQQPGQIAALLPRIPGLALALSNSVQTDMPIDRALAVARALDNVDLRNPTRVVIDNNFGTQELNNPEFGFILKVDPAKIKSTAAPIFADAATTVSPEEELKRKLKTESARVVVLNASPEGNLAAKTAVALSGEGFNVIAVGNADPKDNPQNALITYGDGNPVTREALLQRFSISPDQIRSEPPSPDADLAVVLGGNTMPSEPAN